jgi:hypothetical protein
MESILSDVKAKLGNDRLNAKDLHDGNNLAQIAILEYKELYRRILQSSGKSIVYMTMKPNDPVTEILVELLREDGFYVEQQSLYGSHGYGPQGIQGVIGVQGRIGSIGPQGDPGYIRGAIGTLGPAGAYGAGYSQETRYLIAWDDRIPAIKYAVDGPEYCKMKEMIS